MQEFGELLETEEEMTMRTLIPLLAFGLASLGCSQAEKNQTGINQFAREQASRAKALKSIPDGIEFQFEWSWVDKEGNPVRQNLWDEFIDAYSHDIVQGASWSESKPEFTSFPEFLRTRSKGELGFERIQGQMFLIPREENRKSNLDAHVDLDLDNATFWEGLSEIALQINRKGRVYGAYFIVEFYPPDFSDFEAFTRRCIDIHVKDMRARDVICELLNQAKLRTRLKYENQQSRVEPYASSSLILQSRDLGPYDEKLLSQCFREVGRLRRQIMEIGGLDEFGRAKQAPLPEGETTRQSPADSSPSQMPGKITPFAPEGEKPAASNPATTESSATPSSVALPISEAPASPPANP